MAEAPQDKVFTIELPQLPTSSSYDAYLQGQTQISLQAIGAMAYQNWVKLAAEKFADKRRNYNDYWHAIGQPQLMGNAVVIALTGQRAHDLEYGRASYDLRTVLLGPHVRVKKRGQAMKGKYQAKNGGFYRPIPFSHNSPSSLGTTGAPMGSQYSHQMGQERARELGAWVYKAAKQLSASIERPNRSVQFGERLPGGFAPKLREHHAVDLYKGMVRIEKTYANERTGRHTTQSTYRTWRTISTNVQRGWIVPQTSGVYILKDLQAMLRQTAPAFLAQMRKGQG